jgi:hypothetical protein
MSNVARTNACIIARGSSSRRSPGIKSSRRSCEAITAMRSRKLPSKTIAWWKSESLRKELRALGDGRAASRYYCGQGSLYTPQGGAGEGAQRRLLTACGRIQPQGRHRGHHARGAQRNQLGDLRSRCTIAVATVKEETPQSPLRPLLRWL